MKAKPEPVVDDLRSLRARRDAPAQAKKEAEARELEAELQARKDGALTYARRIVKDLETAVAAKAAWDAAPVDVPALRHTFGEETPVFRAHNSVNDGFAPVEDAALAVASVVALVKELETPTVLSAPRLTVIETALDHAAGHAEGLIGIYSNWIAVRQNAVAQLPTVLKLHYALRRRWQPTEAELALLARQQQKLADAAAAMPAIAPPAARRRVGGADFDAAQPAPATRGPLIENLEDLE